MTTSQSRPELRQWCAAPHLWKDWLVMQISHPLLETDPTVRIVNMNLESLNPLFIPLPNMDALRN